MIKLFVHTLKLTYNNYVKSIIVLLSYFVDNLSRLTEKLIEHNISISRR